MLQREEPDSANILPCEEYAAQTLRVPSGISAILQPMAYPLPSIGPLSSRRTASPLPTLTYPSLSALGTSSGRVPAVTSIADAADAGTWRPHVRVHECVAGGAGSIALREPAGRDETSKPFGSQHLSNSTFHSQSRLSVARKHISRSNVGLYTTRPRSRYQRPTITIV